MFPPLALFTINTLDSKLVGCTTGSATVCCVKLRVRSVLSAVKFVAASGLILQYSNILQLLHSMYVIL